MQAGILYEDTELIAVDKPIGVASIAERTAGVPNLLQQLCEQFGQKLYVVHRLDKEVSGAIIYARTADAHRRLNELFAGRMVQKTYMALVHGRPVPAAGDIERPIRECGSGRMAVDDRRGKPSLTLYKTLEHRQGISLLEINPHTGRRHQIRVHLYSIGHPIIGDLRYGDKNLQSSYPRLMLHCHRMVFPWHGALTITSPLPELFHTWPDYQ